MDKILNYTFKNPEYLEIALTHSSYAHEMGMPNYKNNERQEFLGDAVLEVVVSNYIFNKYKYMQEGEMTKLRAGAVCEETLAAVAKEINLGAYLKLGRGEEHTGGRNRSSILADAMEAVFGAVYLDGGLEEASKFILNILTVHIDALINDFKTRDCKTYLQELIQKKSKEPLVYTIISETGLAHNKEFVSTVSHHGVVLGKGKGKSKKEAEQNAAADAINKTDIH
ncbi:MAG: ribonuclease III [Clostridiales bacterium]|nr:ribonuclease III [Clostridiales bacterium]MCD8159179.1 ribonuclease III [Clostridiales bacterium]